MPDFRLDRALSVRFAQPARRLLNGFRRARVPILMYHAVRRSSGRRNAYFETYTCPEVFARHMQYLRSEGYSALKLGQALGAIDAGSRASKSVVITFDDGYRDFYTEAFPILEACGFTATVFVVSNFANGEQTGPDRSHYMSWQELREVHRHAIEIGSHTMSHPELGRLSAEQIDREIGYSKHIIENELGAQIDSFSYPYAFPEHNRTVIGHVRSSLRAHGYRQGVSTLVGSADARSDRYFLPRLPINSHDDIELFAAKLEGSYDWLHIAQSFYKRFVRSAPGALQSAI